VSLINPTAATPFHAKEPFTVVLGKYQNKKHKDVQNAVMKM
jgi:hypothetical protein